MPIEPKNTPKQNEVELYTNQVIEKTDAGIKFSFKTKQRYNDVKNLYKDYNGEIP